MAIPNERILEALKPTVIFPIREVQDNPSTQEIKKFGKKVCQNLNFDGAVAGSVSTTFANGFLITASNADLANVSVTDVIEILDYDPVRNNVIAKGKKNPCIETSLHWFIYRGFPEIRAIIHVRNTELAEQLENMKSDELTTTSFKVQFITSEIAMKILMDLKGYNSIILRENGILSIGRDLEDASTKLIEIGKKVIKE
jgi:ribulose-5-phosphate 4-epimerase/fuculose-1-phosphate aldolase